MGWVRVERSGGLQWVELYGSGLGSLNSEELGGKLSHPPSSFTLLLSQTARS